MNGYTLFLGSLILVGGAAGDRFGRSRLFVLGTGIFALASLACAAAPGVSWLIAARAAQGVGAALMVPQSLAIISATFPPEVRGRAIGTWAGASAMTTAAGPALGGFLIDSLGWRAAFWINLPLSAAVIALAVAHVPESRAAATGPVDWRGGALAVAAAALLTLGLTALAGRGGPGWEALALIAAGLVAGAGFVLVERRALAPLVPLSLFASKAFTGANLMTLFLYGGLSGALFLLPFDLIGRRGLGAGEAGLALLPIGLIIGLFARRAGALADRVGTRALLVAGSALVAAATVWLALALPGLAAGVVAPVLLLGGGMALVVAPLTTAVMNAAPDALSGAASGISNAASRLAGLFAVALVGAVTALVFAATGAGPETPFGVFPEAGAPDYDAVTAAFDVAWRAGILASALMAALAAVVAWVTLDGGET